MTKRQVSELITLEGTLVLKKWSFTIFRLCWDASMG